MMLKLSNNSKFYLLNFIPKNKNSREYIDLLAILDSFMIRSGICFDMINS